MVARIRAALCHRSLPWVLAILSPVLLLPALDAGFQLDDHFQRYRLLGHGEPAIQLFVFYDGTPERIAEGKARGTLPWWAADDLRHANFRYLSVLTMMLDYRLWPHSAALQHLHSLLWLAALAFAATRFYRRSMGATAAAGLAALLYAIDDAHSLPAAYLANRNALIAAALGVASLIAFQRAREEGWRPGRVLSPLLLALALTAGELALSTAAFLVAYALVVDRAPARERLRALLPHAGVLVAWLAVYRLGRFGASGSGFYRDPVGDPAGFLATLLERISALVLGQWSIVPADFALSAPDAAWFFPTSVSWTVLVLAFIVPIVLRDRVARFLALGAALSLLPIAATGPQNRLLFFVGLGSMGLLARVLRALVRDRSLPLWWKVPAWGVAGLMLATHLVAAPLLGLLSLEYHRGVAERMRVALETVPHDAAVRDQTLVLLNPPDHIYTVTAIPVAKATAGLPVAKRLRALSAGSSPMRVTRVDERSLRLDIERGLFPEAISRYYRGADRGFRLGEQFDVFGMSVEILGLDPGGDPDALLYRFEVPLEHDSLRFLCWSAERVWEECAPPPVGESLELPPSITLFD